jgi:hypothetical protein
LVEDQTGGRIVSLAPGFKRNPGRCPEECKGKRVRVQLVNGTIPAETWAADGRDGCKWERSSFPFAIDGYQLAD